MRIRSFGILPFVIIAVALNAQNTSGSLRGTVQDSAKARVSAATRVSDIRRALDFSMDRDTARRPIPDTLPSRPSVFRSSRAPRMTIANRLHLG
jgi:hypothetical protein